MPCATQSEMNAAVEAATRAYPAWRETSVMTRQRVMFNLQHIIRENMVGVACGCGMLEVLNITSFLLSSLLSPFHSPSFLLPFPFPLPLPFPISLLCRFPPASMPLTFQKELAANITLEQGKTLPDAEGDVLRGLRTFHHPHTMYPHCVHYAYT